MPKKKGKAKADAAMEAPPHRHEPRRMILCFVMFLCCVCFFLLLSSFLTWACGVFGLCGYLCETTAQIHSAYFKRTPPPCAGSDFIDALNIGSSKSGMGRRWWRVAVASVYRRPGHRQGVFVANRRASGAEQRKASAPRSRCDANGSYFVGIPVRYLAICDHGGVLRSSRIPHPRKWKTARGHIIITLF